MISEETLCSKDYKEFERDFYMKVIVPIISTNLVANLLLSILCPFVETKKQESNFQISKLGDLVMRNIYLCVLIMSRTRFRVNPHSIVASLAKWLSVRLRIKWLWVRVPLQSLRNICFLFIASSALLQRYVEFNRLLSKDFLTFYSCSCYSSMMKLRKIKNCF